MNTNWRNNDNNIISDSDPYSNNSTSNTNFNFNSLTDLANINAENIVNDSFNATNISNLLKPLSQIPDTSKLVNLMSNSCQRSPSSASTSPPASVPSRKQSRKRKLDDGDLPDSKRLRTESKNLQMGNCTVDCMQPKYGGCLVNLTINYNIDNKGIIGGQITSSNNFTDNHNHKNNKTDTITTKIDSSVCSTKGNSFTNTVTNANNQHEGNTTKCKKRTE